MMHPATRQRRRRARRPATAALGLLLALAAGADSPRSLPVDGGAATVNDRVITVAEVRAAMQPIERALREAHTGAALDRELDNAARRARRSLIERALILDYFSQQPGMSLPDSVVDARVDELVRTKFGNNRLAFRKALDEEGLTLEEWKTNLKHAMIVASLRDLEVDRKVSVSPRAVRDAYEQALDTFRVPGQVHARMMLIHGGKTPEERVVKRQQADAVRARLVAGESFETLARQVSEGPWAQAGGDLGWIEPATRRPELAAVLKTLEPGGLSEVIEAGGDFYIVSLVARRAASVTPFEQVQETLRAELEKQEAQRLYERWIERLRKRAFIREY